MKKIGIIICELNPLHYGHKYLIDFAKSRGITHLIGIMSGNFVQRGEPSIISKETRTEIALSCGFDLIIELPSIWSMSTAEKFAHSSVSIADALGCVENIIFGSECGNLFILDKISDFVVSSSFSNTIKFHLDKGYTFAKARELTIKSSLGKEYSEIIKSPNNILAVEYLKSLKFINSSIIPITTCRLKTAQGNTFANSSFIRKCIIDSNNEWKKYVPPECSKVISKQIDASLAPVTLEPCRTAMLYKIRTMKKSEFSLIPDISEGLENRIIDSGKEATSLEELISKIKTKRYTSARIRRIIMSSFLGILKTEQDLRVPYIKILGSNQKGLEILKILKQTCKLPIVSRYADCEKLDEISKLIFEKNYELDSIYNLMFPKALPSSLVKKQKFIIKKDE